MTKYWSELLPNYPADCEYKIMLYGDKLRSNKKLVKDACINKGVSMSHQALFICMAMLETTHMTADQRDISKDNCIDCSGNVSLFNLNIDMVKRLGYKDNLSDLNYVHNIPKVVDILNRGITKWGIEGLLNYVRGGYTAFKDGKSYDVYNYKNTIATMLKIIDMKPYLLDNDERIEIYLKHV
jgi:hypothetical protein